MKKKVFVSGCYDLLHSGHVEFFQQASQYGDLYVGIGSDATYLEYKHRKPMFRRRKGYSSINGVIEPEASVQPMIDRYSNMEEVLAWKMPGAGGGYLALVVKDSLKFAENHDEAIHLQIRRGCPSSSSAASSSCGALPMASSRC